MGGVNHQKWVVYSIAITTLFNFVVEEENSPVLCDAQIDWEDFEFPGPAEAVNFPEACLRSKFKALGFQHSHSDLNSAHIPH